MVVGWRRWTVMALVVGVWMEGKEEDFEGYIVEECLA